MPHRTPLVWLARAVAVGVIVLAHAGSGGRRGVETVLEAQAPATFSINDVSQFEGNGGVSTFTFTVTLANPPAAEARVRFATSNGTAGLAAGQFSELSTVLVPGSGSGDITGAPASQYPVTITPVGLPTSITNMSVILSNVNHTFPDDIDILLVGPGGQKVMVMSDAGGTNDFVGTNLEFSAVGALMPDGGAMPSGTYRPANYGAVNDPFPAPAPAGPYETSLGAFIGSNPNGAWTVYIVDDADEDAGSIGGITLSFELPSSDYSSAARELVFPQGVTSQQWAVLVYGDTAPEPHETFFVTLSEPVNAVLGDAQGQGLIINDDGGGPAPTAFSDSYVMAANTSLVVSGPGVLFNDSNPGGGTLSALLVSGATYGTVTVSANGGFVYTPSAGYTGPDSFNYRALTEFGSGGATVSISVGFAPTAAADAFSTPFGRPLTVAGPGVLANDNSQGGGPLTAGLISPTSNGSIVLSGNGGFMYTPAAGFQGADSFSYRPLNMFGAGPTVAATITVGPPPSTVDDAFIVSFNTALNVAAPGVLGNDASNGGGPLTAIRLSNPTNGFLTLASDGGFSYTPNAGFASSDSFTYRAQAVGGPGNTATVSLTVNEPTNLQPPTGLYVSAMSGNTVTFRFTAPALGPDATGFTLEGGLSPGEVIASIPTGSAAPIFTIFVPNGSFYARVHATNAVEKSTASNEIRIHVNAPVAPSAPDLLTSVVDGNTLVLGWRQTFAGGAPTSMLLDVTGSFVGQIPLGLSEGFSAGSVPPGTYTLSMRSANGGGASAASNPITVTVPAPCTAAPQPPSSFLLYRIGGTGYAVWEPPASGPAVSSFVLNVSGSFVGSFSTAARSLSGAVGPGSYTVNVAAVNPCGISAPAASQTLVVP